VHYGNVKLGWAAKSRNLFIALLAFIFVTSVWFSLRRGVPSYRGKDVYAWMLEQNSSALESNPGLMAIGSNAVPFLARALAMEQTTYDRYRWARSSRFQSFAKQLHLGFTWRMPASEVRNRAAMALLAFGFEAAPALPELHAELLRARDTDRQLVIFALSELGPLPESIAWLVKAFPLATNETSVVRHSLLHALGRGGSNAADMAMPLVIGSLNDPDWDVRSTAAQTLAHWAQPAPDAIPPLVVLLKGTNEECAMSACMALGRITNWCDWAVPHIRGLLESTNDFICATAAITLWRLGGDPEETRRLLEPLLASKSTRGAAARYLGEMGPAARASIPLLVKGSHEVLGAWVEMYDRAQCAKAVLQIAGSSSEAYAILEEAITTDKNGWVRETMLGEISHLGAVAQPLVPAVRKALNDPNRDVRHAAAVALAGLENR